MKASNYIEVLQDHLLSFWDIHECNVFVHDGAPAHKAKGMKKWLEEHDIPVLEWPGNSPDLDPIENAWNQMKNSVQKEQPSSIADLKKQAEDAMGQHGQGLLIEASGLYAGATDEGPESEEGNDKVLSVAPW